MSQVYDLSLWTLHESMQTLKSDNLTPLLTMANQGESKLGYKAEHLVSWWRSKKTTLISAWRHHDWYSTALHDINQNTPGNYGLHCMLQNAKVRLKYRGECFCLHLSLLRSIQGKGSSLVISFNLQQPSVDFHFYHQPKHPEHNDSNRKNNHLLSCLRNWLLPTFLSVIFRQLIWSLHVFPFLIFLVFIFLVPIILFWLPKILIKW